MQTHSMQILLKPADTQLRYLPEGPHPYGENRISWVSIQHAAVSRVGSFNVLDLKTRANKNYSLPGRPGFAFAADRPNTFVIGVERQLQLFDMQSGQCTPLGEAVEASVADTIINDGVVFSQGLIFGCKDLVFKEKKAGLYFFRSRDQKMFQLRNDQICSNGKIVIENEQGITLLDIDTPTKKVARYQLDAERGTLSAPESALDFADCPDFPDGMIATPDQQGVIVSFYNPHPAPHGETRQYSLSTKKLEAVWQTPLAPRATCPQLVRLDNQVCLIVTTAIEHMPAADLAQHPNSGCLFIGDTLFSSLPPTPVYAVP